MKFAGGIFALVLMSSNALAQPRDVAKADALFREGRAAMKAGDFRTACPKLEESYRLDPAPGAAVNVGDCLDKQGKVGSALLAYRAARKLLKPGDPRIAPVDAQVAALEKRVPRLTITLAADAPEGIAVKRDGRAVDVADFGRPLLVNPGEVTIVVTAPGFAAARSKLTIREGQAREFLAETGDPTGDSPLSSPYRGGSDPDQPGDEGSTQRTLGYVVGGVGVAALGVAAIFRLQADSKYSEAGCSEKCPETSTLADDADAKVRQGNIAAVLGGMALAGGVVLVFTSPSGEPSAARVRVSPSVGVARVGAQIGGRW